MNLKAILIIAIVIVFLATIFYIFNYQMAAGSVVNVTELNTLDRMRYTAIQMTILDLESQQPTNMSNDDIAATIYEIQQSNKSNDRLTTVEIESLYRNITNGSQIGL